MERDTSQVIDRRGTNWARVWPARERARPPGKVSEVCASIVSQGRVSCAVGVLGVITDNEPPPPRMDHPDPTWPQQTPTNSIPVVGVFLRSRAVWVGGRTYLLEDKKAEIGGFEVGGWVGRWHHLGEGAPTFDAGVCPLTAPSGPLARLPLFRQKGQNWKVWNVAANSILRFGKTRATIWHWKSRKILQ